MMNQVIRVSGPRRPLTETELDAHSRVALIMEHVHRLVADSEGSNTGRIESPEFVRGMIAARALRRDFFGADLFADPAWDILLELYLLHCEQRRTSITKLSAAAAIPPTTALRWMEKLHADGLIDREDDPFDGRRVWVELSSKGVAAMESFLRRIGPQGVPA